MRRRSGWTRWLALAATAPLATGCVTGPSEPARVTPAAPRLVEYTAAEQRQAADELEALPPGAILPRLVDDYLVLRDQVRQMR